MNLGPMEILIIAVVVILLFGAAKMPKMARSLGQSMRILKAETKGMREDDAAAEVKPAAAPQVAAAAGESSPEQLKQQIDDLQAKLDKQGEPHKNAS